MCMCSESSTFLHCISNAVRQSLRATLTYAILHSHAVLGLIYRVGHNRIHARRRLSKYKLHFRNSDVKSYRLVYKRVDSEGVGGEGGSRGGMRFGGGLQNFTGPLNPELKPSQLTPLLGDMTKGGCRS